MQNRVNHNHGFKMQRSISLIKSQIANTAAAVSVADGLDDSFASKKITESSSESDNDEISIASPKAVKIDSRSIRIGAEDVDDVDQSADYLFANDSKSKLQN